MPALEQKVAKRMCVTTNLPEDDQRILTRRVITMLGLFRTIYFSKESFYMVSPQTVFT